MHWINGSYLSLHFLCALLLAKTNAGASDLESLDNLRDVAVPPSVPWWPPAPGWWFVAAIAVIAVVVVGLRKWRVWTANAYRRAALAELSAATSVTDAADILKRTALVAYPRSEVAALSGTAWCLWLETTGGHPMSEQASEALTLGVFAERDAGRLRDLVAFAADWVNRHGGTDGQSELQPNGNHNKHADGQSVSQ